MHNHAKPCGRQTNLGKDRQNESKALHKANDRSFKETLIYTDRTDLLKRGKWYIDIKLNL